MSNAANLVGRAATKSSHRRDMRLNVWAIRNQRDYQRARKVVDALVFRIDLGTEERERLEVMMTLMEAYENEYHEIGARRAGPAEFLKGLMANHDMTASDLGRVLGNRALGSLILNGKRELSKAHIRKLAQHFAVDPGVFF